MLKKLLCCLLLATVLPSLAQAQLVPYISGTYRLKDGTGGAAKLSIDIGKNLLLVKKDKEKLSYTPAQVDYFQTSYGRMKSVGGFTMKLMYGKTSVDVREGYATVLDSGRVELLEYTVVTTGLRAGPEYRTRSVPNRVFLLRPVGSTDMLTVRNESNMVNSGTFDAEDQQTLLRVFNNDAELQQLLASGGLNARTFPDFVRAYNRRKS